MTSQNQPPQGEPPQDQPPAQAVSNLPVFQTVVTALPLTYGDPALLLRAAAGGLILVAAAAAIFLVAPNIVTLLLMLLFAPLAAYSHFGVNWYRIVLLGPEGLVRPTLRWDRRHWRVFGYALAINFATLLLLVVLTLILPFLGPFLGLAVIYLTARLSFIFPALAVEEDYSLGLSWRHTQGQGLRLMSALLVTGIPLYILLSIILNQVFTMLIGMRVAAVAALGPQNADVLAQMATQVSPVAVVTAMMISTALPMAVLAVLFSIVAIAFRTCTGWVPAASATVADVFGDGDDALHGGDRP